MEENKRGCEKTIHIKKTWSDFEFEVKVLAEKIKASKMKISNIYGVPRGGLVVAIRLSHLLGIPLITNLNFADDKTLWVDDVIETGKTLINIRESWRVALYWNPEASFKPDVYAFKKDGKIWIDFPWESQ